MPKVCFVLLINCEHMIIIAYVDDEHDYCPSLVIGSPDNVKPMHSDTASMVLAQRKFENMCLIDIQQFASMQRNP